MNAPHGEPTSDFPQMEPISDHRTCSRCGQPKRASSTLNMENHCQQCDVLNGEVEPLQSSSIIGSADVDRLLLGTDFPSTTSRSAHRSRPPNNRHSINTSGHYGDHPNRSKYINRIDGNKWNRHYSLHPSLRTKVHQLRRYMRAFHGESTDQMCPNYTCKKHTKVSNPELPSAPRRRLSHLRQRNLVNPVQYAQEPIHLGLDERGVIRHGSDTEFTSINPDSHYPTTRTWNSAVDEPSNVPFTEHHCSFDEQESLCDRCQHIIRTKWLNSSSRKAGHRANNRRSSCLKCGSSLPPNSNDLREPYGSIEDDSTDSDFDESDIPGVRFSLPQRRFSPTPEQEYNWNRHSMSNQQCMCSMEQDEYSYPMGRAWGHRLPIVDEHNARKRFNSVVR